MVKRLSVACFIFLQAILLIAPAHAQPRCSFQHYSTADGLSDNRVTSITKDHEGFLWMGTWAGINRFDGLNFVTYKSHPGDSSELKNNRIDNIVEGEDGFLWLLAYDKKIYRFNKKTEQFLSISKFLEARSKRPIEVDKIVVMHNHQIAIITKHQGVFLVSPSASGKPIVKWFSTDVEANHTLSSNTITAFYYDSLQRTWMGGPNGLSCFTLNSKGDFENVIIPHDLMLAHVTAIAERDSAVFFGTESGKIIRLAKIKNELTSIDLKAGKINDLKFSNSKMKLFCSTSKGRLVTLDANARQSISVATFGNTELLSIYEDQRGMLWIEPENIGVIMFDPQVEKFQYFTQNNFSNHTLESNEYKVLEDRNGTVFVNMRGWGFGYFDVATQRVEYFYNDPGRNDYKFSNVTSAEYYDPAGILWLNTREGGLEKITLAQNEFIYERLVNNTQWRAENEVRGVYGDSQGQLWVASKTGKVYVRKEGKVTKTMMLDNPVYSTGVYTIIEDTKRNIWLGTKGNGLFKAEPIGDQAGTYRITHFVHDPKDPYSISSDLIYSLLEDQEGRIWVGTYGGGVNLVNQLDGETRFYNPQNKFLKYPSDVCNRVRSLALDAHGKVWIGTTEGLLIFDLSKNNYNSDFTRYVKIPLNIKSLGDNDVQYIYRGSDNTMWVLTSSGGLNKAVGASPMESLTFLNYSKRDGLPSDYLLSCVEDSVGNLWIATQNGISRFDEANASFQNYNVSDGLPASGFSEASCTVDANGELVFGLLNGYVHFNPQNIAQLKIVGNIVFTNLQVNNEDVVPVPGKSLLHYTINHTKEIILDYDQNVISIDYRMLDYRSQEKITYAYRLVGLSPTWRNNKDETRASFTNLSPGTYTFEVKSTSTDLYSNVASKALNITILPPPWKTWWAYALYCILGLVVLWIIRKYVLIMLSLRQRIIIERRLADFKLNFFTNVSHELRTPLTLILNPIEEILRTEKLSRKGNQHLTIVRKNAQRMSRFINQLLDLRKAQSGKATLRVSKIEIVAFVRRILGYFADLADQKRISMAIEADAELFVWVDAEKIDIVIYNVLANALKFTPEGKKIRIVIQVGPGGTIDIHVIDEGNGVPDNQLDAIFGLYFGGQPSEGNNFKGTGIGLALSKELIQLHHGKISAGNNVPCGLIVAIELMSGKDHFENNNTTFVDVPCDFEPTSSDCLTADEDIVLEQALAPPVSDPLPQLLLVEDNQDLRSFLQVQLSQIYRVVTAENGEEGLQKARHLLPDVVLSDVMMPIMDGITMLDKLKNDPSTSHIPVVLLSAKFSVESQIEGLKYGANSYIAKPFRNDFLLATLNNLIEQRKRLFNSILQNKKTIEVRPTEITITSYDELFLKKVIDIVEEKMKEMQFNIDVVADSMSMSRTPFYKKLKSLTGLSPVEFVREIRLKRSIQYLDAGEHDISVIAFEVGFKSAKYFSTCFKQRFNETPTDYLKSKMRVES